jgi:hypothetical protein
VAYHIVISLRRMPTRMAEVGRLQQRTATARPNYERAFHRGAGPDEALVRVKFETKSGFLNFPSPCKCGFWTRQGTRNFLVTAGHNIVGRWGRPAATPLNPS